MKGPAYAGMLFSVILTARDDARLHGTAAVDAACWGVRTAITGTRFPPLSAFAAVFSNVRHYLELTSAEETRNPTHLGIVQEVRAVKAWK